MIPVVHARVVRARGVRHRVLDELETGQPHAVERLVVGPAGVAIRDGVRVQVVERPEPIERGAEQLEREDSGIAPGH